MLFVVVVVVVVLFVCIAEEDEDQQRIILEVSMQHSVINYYGENIYSIEIELVSVYL